MKTEIKKTEFYVFQPESLAEMEFLEAMAALFKKQAEPKLGTGDDDPKATTFLGTGDDDPKGPGN